MKLTWRPLTGVSASDFTPPIIIGDDSLPRGPGMKFILSAPRSFAWAVQTAEAVRRSEVESFDRANLRTTFSAIVQCVFRTADECRQFLDDLALDLGSIRKGDLIIDYTQGGSRKLTGVLQSVEAQDQTGASCVITYTWLGGAISRNT